MLSEIQATALLVLVLSHAYLQVHCFRIRKAAPAVFEKADNLSDAVGEMVNILSDVADLLEDSPAPSSAGPAGMTQAPAGIGGILTNALMQRMMMPAEHGTTQEQSGEVSEGQATETPTEASVELS
jgi:hypothetical protein